MNPGAPVFSESGVQQMWKHLLFSVNTGNCGAGGATGRVGLKASVCPVVKTKTLTPADPRTDMLERFEAADQ